jgi:hypothetical protein
MKKKFFTMFLSFVLMIGLVSMTYAKKEDQVEKKTASKKVVETKEPLKEKISVAVDIFNQYASMRMWMSDKMGIDFSAGFGIETEPSAFSFNLGAGLVFPMIETSRLNANIVPGLNIGYEKVSYDMGLGETVDADVFTFLAGAGFEIEGFIVPEVLSIASSVGVFIGIQSIEDTTRFIFDVARGIGITPLIVRFYF